MGSSVFHGGFSTFVSLSVLAPTETYIFQVFFKMWFGIVLFGMANGFLLLPVILSFVGNVETSNDANEGSLPPENVYQKNKQSVEEEFMQVKKGVELIFKDKKSEPNCKARHLLIQSHKKASQKEE